MEAGSQQPAASPAIAEAAKRKSKASVHQQASKAHKGGGWGHRNVETYANEAAKKKERRAQKQAARREWFRENALYLRECLEDPNTLVQYVLTAPESKKKTGASDFEVPDMVLSEKQRQRIGLIHYFTAQVC